MSLLIQVLLFAKHVFSMAYHVQLCVIGCLVELYKYREVAHDLMSSFAGKVTNRANFDGLFATAWNSSLTPSSIVSKFRSCGIFPFNPDAISSLAYLPNYLHSVFEIMAGPTLENEMTSEITASLDTTPPASEPSAGVYSSSQGTSVMTPQTQDELDIASNFSLSAID